MGVTHSALFTLLALSVGILLTLALERAMLKRPPLTLEPAHPCPTPTACSPRAGLGWRCSG